MHNNASESALRPQVLGRRNWLFVGNDDAAGVIAIFVSLLASCRLHGIGPRAYLRDLFCLHPAWPMSRVLELAPVNWRRPASTKTLSSVASPTSSAALCSHSPTIATSHSNPASAGHDAVRRTHATKYACRGA